MNTTAWILVAIVGLLIGWDIFAVWKYGYTGTISYDVLTACKAHPAVAFGLGFVAGHLLWPQ